MTEKSLRPIATSWQRWGFWRFNVCQTGELLYRPGVLYAVQRRMLDSFVYLSRWDDYVGGLTQLESEETWASEDAGNEK